MSVARKPKGTRDGGQFATQHHHETDEVLDDEYTESDWRHEVVNGDTKRGFEDWADAKRNPAGPDRSATAVLDSLQTLLSGREWDADTAQEVGHLVEAYGRGLSDPFGPGSQLNNADLRNVDMWNEDFSGASMAGARMGNSGFCRCDLTGVDLTGVSAQHASFVESDMTGATIEEADLTHVNFSEATLSHATMTGSNLTGASFAGANLSHAKLIDCNLADANFGSADMSGTVINRSYRGYVTGLLSETQLGNVVWV